MKGLPAQFLPLYHRFSGWVAEHLGLNFPPERFPDLRRGAAAACSDFGFEGPESCMENLMQQPVSREKSEVLASHLTVGETYFFRDSKIFAALESVVLPELFQARRERGRFLRIWSAGCSTGEEPYSVALLLPRLLPDLAEWHITILATDINPRSLKKAVGGVYGEWSFRGTPVWVKETGFVRLEENTYEVRPEIRQLVSFSYLNLAEDVYPALLTNTTALDLILCRNVLMYFIPTIARKVLRKFAKAAAEGGWLCLSPCDSFHLSDTDFEPGQIPDASLFRKRRRSPRRAMPARAQAAALPTNAEAPSSGAKLPVSARITAAREPLPTQPREKLTQAAELLAEGRYSEASATAEQILQEQPQEVRAMKLLARACANEGKLAEAMAWCERALQVDGLDSHLHFLRATILQEQGEIEEAVSALQRVSYLEPDFILAYFTLGNLFQHLGQPVQAQAAFSRALNLLDVCPPDQLLPESEGMTAGRLREIIRSTRRTELAA